MNLTAGARRDSLPSGKWGHDVSPLSEREFEVIRTVVEREAGIHLSESKKALVYARLARVMRELGLHNFGEYAQRLQHDASEVVRLLDCISTNETSFFRDGTQFDLLAEQMVPRWIAQAAAGERPQHVRIWSAACSTGQEPYSIAMVLLANLPPSWKIEILASDISTRVLETARAATWPLQKAQEIPLPYLKSYMLKGVRSREGVMKASAELRAAVTFERINLVRDTHRPAGMFDAIFCRNVLIYFSLETKRQVLDHLFRHLEPGGHLFLGHSESLNGTAGVVTAGPNVYRCGRSGSVR